MIEEVIDTRQFRFSAIVDEAYQDMVPTLLELEDRLNEEIEISDYTDTVRTIYFIPMILEDRDGYEERLEYEEDTKTLLLQVFIDIESNPSKGLISSLYLLQKELGKELISEDFVFKLKKDY